MRDLRAAVRGLSGRAVARAHDGDREGAADDLEAAAMAAGAASPRGALIGALVKIACVSIACSGVRNSLEFTTFTDEEAARICRALEAAMPADLISQAMLYERACGHVMFSAMGEGKVLGSDLLGSDPSRSADIRKPAFLKKLRSLPYRAWIYAQEVVYLDAMTRNSELSHKRYRELAGNKLEEEINAGLPRWAMLTGALIPVFARSHAAADAGIARVEATKALLALTGYKAGHGAYPASLDEAQTGACRIGEDPFSGKPLVYRRQGEGFLLYSIGDDLKDDGGKPGGKADLVTTMAR